MEFIYLDTALLAVPNYAVDPQTAEELVDRVNHFAQIVMPGIPIQLAISADAEELLWGSNIGPSHDQIEQFLELMELSHVFSARDLAQQYSIILDQAARSDQLSGIALIRWSDFRTDPALPEGLVPVNLRDETDRTFGTVAALQFLNEPWSVGSGIQGIHDSYSIELQVDEAVGVNAPQLGNFPVQIASAVQAISHVEELVDNAVALRAWVNSDTADDIHFAITLAALALLRSEVAAGIESLRQFAIGPGFLESLRACQCFGTGRFASVTLSLCAQIVANRCTRPIRPFGKPDQETRDFQPSLAMRVHLTEGKEGLRLMLWEGSGLLEFANVGVKHEEAIERGHRGKGLSLDLEHLF